jgi:hypothetical protein
MGEEEFEALLASLGVAEESNGEPPEVRACAGCESPLVEASSRSHVLGAVQAARVAGGPGARGTAGRAQDGPGDTNRGSPGCGRTASS